MVDWIVKIYTYGREYGMRWRGWIHLDDFDFMDDLALLFHIHQQMQVKKTSVAAASESVDLNIHKRESKILE